MPAPPKDPRQEGAGAPTVERTSVPRFQRVVAGTVGPTRRQVPPPLPPAHRPQPRGTMTGFPAPPAPESAPAPPLRTLKGMGPRQPRLSDLGTMDATATPPATPPSSVVPIPWSESRTRPGVPESAPPRSLSPPGGVKVDVEVGGQRVKIRTGDGLKKLAPWLVPLVLSALGTLGGAVVGYYEGLAAAGRRVAAVEERQRLLGEQQTKQLTRIEELENGAAAESQANRSERATRDRQLEEIRARLPKIEGLAPPH